MLTAEGPGLIEYNARFGDPECQVLMMRLESDLLEIMYAIARGRLGEIATPRFSNETALTIVMAANGYPGTTEKGGRIAGIDSAEATGATGFQAGTSGLGDELVACGGRVQCVNAIGQDVRAARREGWPPVRARDF